MEVESILGVGDSYYRDKYVPEAEGLGIGDTGSEQVTGCVRVLLTLRNVMMAWVVDVVVARSVRMFVCLASVADLVVA